MKHLLRLTLLLFVAVVAWPCSATETENHEAVTALLTRVTNAASSFETVLDTELAASDGSDVFVITAKNSKPCIKGSSLSAITTGINWYLNHYAHVNIAWNNLTTDLSATSLPVPATEETHTASVDYRYYLNYCTFSYSMSTWTWERWQQEIDWMALHGINMPLQIVGLDVVWKKLLTEDLGYTSEEANDFIAGPCFQAWWGMNNLEGWGGPNPDWWYTRQEALATKILARERELGMQPVLPGYAGMVPSDIATKKGYTANNQGNWCYFTRPYILDPNSNAFAEVSEKYYARLAEVMGTSEYYSMDPFHEGANTDGIDVASAYSKIADAMTTANSDGKWVIQFWQWSSDQYNVLSKVSKGKLIVLDLFSDAHTHFGEYNGHDAVYCMLPNFGGRTGLFGRLSKVMTDFYTQKSSYSNVKGIGATPEAIEQVPVLYDALFELPWRSTKPDPQTWLADYATARYGTTNTEAQAAWEKLRNSALNCETSLQGPHEAVVCARPALSVGSVSSWGGTDIFYDPQDVADAATRLLSAKSELSGENYSYDLTDFSRQALTDYAYYLLKGVNAAHTAKETDAYATRRDAYLQLILDLDELLSTNKNFMLGRWTQMARAIADEATGTTSSDKDWLELDNARTLITTWGDRNPSEYGGLRDYSYREWGGMLKDFYYPRWQKYFDNLDNGTSLPDWFTNDWSWAHSSSYSYSDTPTGNTADVATTLFAKYFVDFTVSTSSTYHIYRHIETDARTAVSLTAYRGQDFVLPVATLPEGVTATTAVDLNNNGQISTDEQSDGTTIAIPTTAVSGRVTARLTLSDGTIFTFYLTLKDEITTPRTVTVQTADASQGSVAISGTTDLSVTNTDEVTMTATPAAGYDFAGWTDAEGNTVSTDNTYTYYGAAAATFTANFVVNKWGTPTEDLTELSTISDYGQYLGTITVSQNGGEEQTIYTASACPSTLCQTTSSVKAPQGSKFNIHWTDKGGMNYCRLSAYIDLNSDGDFDDDDEFLAVVGDQSTSGNSALNDYTLSVLLPYDVPEGLTHLRLRFDSSWLTDGIDATTNAMPAKASTKRMVYDVPVLVTTESATACTVTVQTSNTKQGTVDANGQTDTYTYGAGEEIVLRCYPTDGYAINYWTDSYGRHVPTSWMDGNFLRFKAPESGTYTAYFKSDTQLTVDDWTLLYETNDDGLTITGVVSGSGALDLSAENSVGTDITRINPDVFRGNTALTELTLPATLVSFDTSLNTSLTGSGTSNALITPTTALAAGTPWSLTLTAANDGSTYNDWGSGLLATGTDALANSYDGGFQLYLAAAGTLTVKVGSSEYGFSNALGESFSITMSYDGSSTLTVTVTNASGTTETKTISTTLSAISSFASSIPTGVNITSLLIDDPYLTSYPLSGCTALTDIYVADGSTLFSSVSGKLYTADATQLLAYPEGRLTQRAFTLKTIATTPRTLYSAPTASVDGATYTTGTTLNARTATTSTVSIPTALVTLVANTDGTYTLRHLNSGRSFTTASDAANKPLQLPTTADGEALAFTYALTISNNAPTLTFTTPAGLYVGVSGYNASLRTAAASWTLEEVDAITLTPNEQGWTSTCLPVPVITPSSDVATIYKVIGVNGTTVSLIPIAASTVVAAGEPILAISNSDIDLTISTTDGEALSDNKLSGTTVARSGFTENTVYLLDDAATTPALELSSGTTVDANTAYLPQSICTDVSASTLPLSATLPEDGKVYQIYAVFSTGAEKPLYWNGKTHAINVSADLSSDETRASYFFCHKLANAYNQYLFVNKDGRYLKYFDDSNTESATTAYAASSNVFTLQSATIDGNDTYWASADGVTNNDFVGLFHLIQGGNYLTPRLSDGVFVGAGSGKYYDNVDPWRTNAYRLVEVSTDDIAMLKLPAGRQLSTFSSPFPVTIPDGFTAYTASSYVEDTDGSATLKLSAIEDTVIPENTGVILYRETTTDAFTGSLTPAENSTETTASTETTRLVPTGGDGVTSPTSETAYVLTSKASNGIGFYPLSTSTEERTFAPFRAYLVTATEASAVKLDFGDGATAITSPTLTNDDATNAPLYDLSGRRVAKPARGGVYIQGNKKFITK